MALITLLLFSVCLALFSYAVTSHVPAGARRAGLLLPVWVVFFALPVFAVNGKQEPFTAQSLCCIMSMSAFKIIALSFGRGCLSNEELNAWTFVGVCLLPVIPSSEVIGAKRCIVAISKVKHGMLHLAYFALLALLASSGFRAADFNAPPRHVVDSTAPDPLLDSVRAMGLLLPLDPKSVPKGGAAVLMPALIRILSYVLAGAALLFEVDGVGCLVDAAALWLFGIAAEPHFDRVWLSTSFTELWSRRWNLTVSSVLKDAVYLPVVEGRLVASGPPHPRRGLQLAQSPLSSPAKSTTSIVRQACASDALPYAAPPSPPAGCVTADDNATYCTLSEGPSIRTGSCASTRSETALYGRGSYSGVGDDGNVSAGSAWSGSGVAAAEGYGSGDSSLATSLQPGGGLRRRANTVRHHGTGTEGRNPHVAATHAEGELVPKHSGPLEPLRPEGPQPRVPAGSPQLQPQPQPQPQRRRSGRRPGASRRFVAVLLTFFVSGLWHELVCFSMTHTTTGGYWLLLFTLQAPVLLIESELMRLARARGVGVPPVVARILTLGLLLVELTVLWYPPMATTGMLASIMRQSDAAVAAAAEAVKQVRTYVASAAVLAQTVTFG